MKVDFNGHDGSTLSSITSPQREPAETGAVSGTDRDHSIGEDKATLSGDRVSVTALTARALASTEIRQDKVEALRQAIANRDYRIEPLQIAAALIAESE
ncbi:MAG TPA: flagellar biosynthesis anti-sigma factor FlgM [Terriglobales bacterium]|nr:flagellar biosynthesis anti-sigma factor FlgM [Terriglobales bacterium]